METLAKIIYYGVHLLGLTLFAFAGGFIIVMGYVYFLGVWGV